MLSAANLFGGTQLDFRTVPLFIEYTTDRAGRTVRDFAEALSDCVREADSARRGRLHAAAVFACNFSNHLYAIAGRLLEKEGLDFGILGPLVLETAAKAVATDNPAAVQTGPASAATPSPCAATRPSSHAKTTNDTTRYTNY